MDWEPGHEHTISTAGIRMVRIKARARGRCRRRRRRGFDIDDYLLELVHLERCFRQMSCCRWELVRLQRFKTEERGEVREVGDMSSFGGLKYSRGFCSFNLSRVQARRC